MTKPKRMSKERLAEIESEVLHLITKLKMGMYDGGDIMSARLRLDELLQALKTERGRVEELEGALKECREAVKYTNSYSTVIGIVNRALEQETRDE